MLHKKSVAVSLLISALTVGLYFTTANADASKSNMASKFLPPGGNTIGGPGFYDGDPGVGGAYQGPKITACITIKNSGPLVKILTEPQASFDDLVFPNETETRCAHVRKITLVCEAGPGACRAFWRVDRLPRN